MKRLRVYHIMFPGLLLITVLAALFWQSQPNSSQKRQDQLNAALLNAAIYGDATAARNLLRNGADPNSCQQPSSLREKLQRVCPALHYIDHSDPQPLYETALGLAVLNYKPQVVRVLLAGGADVTRKDSYGQTALDLVYMDKGDKIFVMLTEAAKKRGLAEVSAGSH